MLCVVKISLVFSSLQRLNGDYGQLSKLTINFLTYNLMNDLDFYFYSQFKLRNIGKNTIYLELCFGTENKDEKNKLKSGQTQNRFLSALQ